MIAKTCKFYENSKCVLKDKFCDLNCNQMFFEDGDEFSHFVESATRRQPDDRVLERAWAKMR